MAAYLHKLASRYAMKIIEDNTDNGSCVRICYSYGYGDTVAVLNKTRADIARDYPNVKDDNITIRILSERETNTHANFVCLSFPIPIEEFLRLRQCGELVCI